MSKHLQSLRYLWIIAFFVLVNLEACKKFVQISPPSTEIAGSTVYSNNSSAASVMTGLYTDMTVNPALSSGGASIGYYMGLAADELTSYDPTKMEEVQFYKNALSSFSNGYSNYYFWTELYNEIYVTNAVLTGLANSPNMTDSIKQQLTGEAKFMRAFLHFYATNLYGDIPLVTTINYLTNNSISPTPQAQVYQQIITDLIDAQTGLNSNFVDASGNYTSERTRPNRGAATALLARVYLYALKWDSAEAAATAVIANSALYSLDSLNSVFLANSSEAIWQLQPTNQDGLDTWDAYYYLLQGPPGPGQGNSVALSSYLTNAIEQGDERLAAWVGTLTSGSNTYYYPFKYQVFQSSSSPLPEYTMVIRLAEQYLIRAEARAQQGNSTGALADLNAIRNRAGLANYSGPIDQQSLLAAILHERQIELFSEWGHRWFDLKRTGNLNSLMGAPGNVCMAKNGTWNIDWALLPLARQELLINQHLIQNPGY